LIGRFDGFRSGGLDPLDGGCGAVSAAGRLPEPGIGQAGTDETGSDTAPLDLSSRRFGHKAAWASLTAQKAEQQGMAFLPTKLLTRTMRPFSCRSNPGRAV